MLKILLALALLVSSADILDPWYRGYNEKYFNNSLPQNVIISHNLHDDRFMAYTEHTADGWYHIEFNPKYEASTKQERFTLFHEQCHLEQMISGEVEFDDHGPKWQGCMHRLANEGAFEDLW